MNSLIAYIPFHFPQERKIENYGEHYAFKCNRDRSDTGTFAIPI